MAIRATVGTIAVATESTPGTFLEPSGAGTKIILSAFDVKFTASIASYERKEMRPHWGKLDPIIGMKTGELSFKILLYNGTAGTAPDHDLILQHCGWGFKDNGVTDCSYVPLTTLGSAVNGFQAKTNGSASVAAYIDGKRYALGGSQGNIKFSAKVGEPVVMEVMFKGAYQVPINAAVPATNGVASPPVPPNFLNAALGVNFGSSYNGFELESWSLDSGYEISEIKNANSSAGISQCLATNRRLTMKFDPLESLTGVHDFWALMGAATSGTFTIGPIGAANNRFAFTCSRIIYSNLTLGERDGFLVAETDVAITTTSSYAEATTTECLLVLT